MGITHGNKKTYPRLGSILGFCTPDQGKYVSEKIMLVQRDNGNHVEYVSLFHFKQIFHRAFLVKYTIDRMGLENYKAEVEKLLGYALAPARLIPSTGMWTILVGTRAKMESTIL